jgi:hypothetical protein
MSLILVAYYFVHKEIPSTEYASKLMKAFPDQNLFQPQEFRTFR